jgi:excisionase family DNA binding protein
MLQATTITDDLITVSTTARELGVAEGTVRLMADRGVLPCTKLASGLRLFRRDDVERVRAAREFAVRSADRG